MIDDKYVADGDCDYDNNNSDDADNKNYLILQEPKKLLSFYVVKFMKFIVPQDYFFLFISILLNVIKYY